MQGPHPAASSGEQERRRELGARSRRSTTSGGTEPRSSAIASAAAPTTGDLGLNTARAPGSSSANAATVASRRAGFSLLSTDPPSTTVVAVSSRPTRTHAARAYRASERA